MNFKSYFGLTKDPIRQKLYACNENHNKLTWKERIQIVYYITYAASKIHKVNAIHRDLHSGNILFHQIRQTFRISDLGFCGPADNPLNSVYGNLHYTV